MALDPSIALGFRGLQLADPMEQAGRAMALSQMGTQNQFMQQRMEEANRLSALAASRQKAYAASGGDANKFLSALGQMGDIEGAQAYQEHLLNQQKSEAELDDKRAGTQQKRMKIISEVAAFGFNGGTLEHAHHAADLLEQSGLGKDAAFVRRAIEQNPNATPDQIRSFFKPYISSQLSASDLLLPKFEDIGGQKVNVNPNIQVDPLQKTQTPDSVASNAVAREGHQVTMRGQNMTAETAREGHAVTKRGQNLVSERAKEQNNITASQPKLTESQGKAQGFGRRAKEAHDIHTSLEGKYSPAAINAKMSAEDTPFIGGIAGTIGNVMLSANDQKAEQAQRDFINAILRDESGAVISDAEFNNARKQYFPQPGDSKAVIAQKKRNREMAIKGLDVKSGPAGGFSKQPSPAPSGGIKFLGFE